MSVDLLSRDNPLLSRPTIGDFELHRGLAINCNEALTDLVTGYVRSSLAANTKRAYISDLTHFVKWGGRIPSSVGEIAAYLAHHAAMLKVSTLVRRVASISKAHSAQGFDNPVRSELVTATLRGIKRSRGIVQREAKPLLRDDLLLLLGTMGNSPKDVRDRALLLVGFAGGFRRSELIGLDVGDIEHVRQGLIVTIQRSKTDQEGAGRKIGIPHGRTRYCPVAAFHAWLTLSGVETGPVFRRIDRHDRIHIERLSGEAVSLVLRERLAAANVDPAGYSGHSLRAGFATSAAQAGVSNFKIRAQTGHASDGMLARYVRYGGLFTDNAAGLLL